MSGTVVRVTWSYPAFEQLCYPNISKLQNLAKLAKHCETKKPFAKSSFEKCKTSICETLRISYLQIFAKPCKPKAKLRNLYLRNLAKLVFAILVKYDLQKHAKQCEAPC